MRKQTALPKKTNVRGSDSNAWSDHAAGPEGLAVAPPSYGLEVIDQQPVQASPEPGQGQQALESTIWPGWQLSHEQQQNGPVLARFLNPPIQRKKSPAPTSSGADTKPEAETPAAVKTSPEKDDSQALVTLASEIETLLKPTMTGLEFKRYWPQVEHHITSPPKKKARAIIRQKFSALTNQTLLEKLGNLSAADRAKVAGDVYNRFLASLSGLEAADLVKEFNTLDGFVRGNIEAGIRGYVSVRTALIDTFGDIPTINSYYKSFVPANFPSASSTVRGSRMKVHRNLQKQLQKAATLLASKKIGDKTWLDIAEAGISRIGGFNIRENRNNPGSLSKHSFGWAFDIDAELNPNVKRWLFPASLVQEFTGEDVYAGEANKKLRAGGTAETLLPHARALVTSSEKFKASFASKQALRSAVATYLKQKGLAISDQQATALFELLKQGNKKNNYNKKALQQWLQTAKTAQTNVPESKPESTPEAAPPATVWSEAPTAAAFLIQAYQVFRRTTTASGAPVKAAVAATPGTIAAHGFLNLPAELVAALTGSDGGDLKWLGTVRSGTKDFMHFELKSSPALPKAAAKPEAANPEAEKATGEEGEQK